MKHITSLILSASLLIIGLPACAAPLPENKPQPLKLSWDTAPVADLRTVLYSSMPEDATWQASTNAVGVTTVTVPSQRGMVFFLTYLDATGSEGPRSDAVTNNITLPSPGGLKFGK